MKIEKGIPIPNSSKFQNGKNNYKSECINMMLKMEIGDSIRVKDRSLDTVKYSWLWKASMKLGLKRGDNAFIIKPIDKKNHRVWRIR